MRKKHFEFVLSEFPNADDQKRYLVGYKNFTKFLGTTMHDGTLLTGIPFITTDDNWRPQDIEDTEEPITIVQEVEAIDKNKETTENEQNESYNEQR